jgi:hypothetical protein
MGLIKFMESYYFIFLNEECARIKRETAGSAAVEKKH